MFFDQKRRRKYERAFTLVELLAVMVILSLLGGAVVYGVNKQISKAKIQATQTQISQLSSAISTFQLDCGFYPPNLEALISAPSGRACKGYTKGGYLERKEVPVDAWKITYNYTTPGLHNTETFDLWSNGPNGDEGDSDDVTNWADTTTDASAP